jgi:multicomponent Na+:H+ antiporter subunit E
MLFFCVWLAASASLEVERVLAGLAVTGGVALVTVSRTTFWSGLDLRPQRAVAGLGYLALFLREMVSSNISVLRYVYALRVATRPKVVRIGLRTTGPRERLALMNTVALTPGTLPVDLDGEHLDLHLLDVELAEGADQSIAKFETLLEKAIG